MVQSLRKRSTIPLYLSVPRIKDLVVFMAIAGPTLITMLSKVRRAASAMWSVGIDE
jgi:hypothetical protein